MLAAVAVAAHAAAAFADAAGFSGRGGADCTACHTPAPAAPGAPPAVAVLEGLPEAWDVGATYTLTVRVDGGPAAMPAPQPQGGFDLAVGGGHLRAPAGAEDLLRLVGDPPHEATYRPAGTLMRTWRIDWVAPGLEAPPAAVPVWLAVLAANGNHVVATNASDGGERLDATATLTASVPPSAAASAAWRDLPLAAPNATAARAGTGWLVEGTHADGNATRLAWRLDGGPWRARDTAPTWRLDLAGLAPGTHRLEFRSEGADRLSPAATLAFGDATLAEKAREAGRQAPAVPLPLAALVPLLAAAIRRRP